ncbi:GNAT family N-acetyltransferase [Seonamhaeicola sp.]|uniref:GNAT family N-acetyltransferase n=1 Tax=Seonamhaeicola sp. TaxID=1912245 RepID=UPI002619E755|nr:GNAT family N-acetyltransferase [Seonamhaeicola sp.]
MLINNPFTSGIFTSVWRTHFAKRKPSETYGIFNDVSFVKYSLWPILINTGKNLTKGIAYTINSTETETNTIKNKVFLILDVASYFDVPRINWSTPLRQKRIKQYPGYLINLKNYEDFSSYLSSTFSKKSIQKFNRYRRRLEQCFDITYKIYHGEIDKANYDFIFDSFKNLLVKRFDDKRITNNNLNPEEWNFYKDVAYPLILEKKASLFVVYNGETPIAVRLNYYSDTVIFDAITVFDIDYDKFHLGKISLYNMLVWAFDTDYSIFDFSKGYFDYKESWSDTKYDFEYHIVYNSKSLIANLIANGVSSLYKLKQYLREKAINKKMHRLTFILKKTPKKQKFSRFKASENNEEFNINVLSEINISDQHYAFIKKYVYDFLYLKSEHYKNLKIYKLPDSKNRSFLVKGSTASVILSEVNK